MRSVSIVSGARPSRPCGALTQPRLSNSVPRDDRGIVVVMSASEPAGPPTLPPRTERAATMIERLAKPQYLFRPRQIIRRFFAGDVVRTPWCEMRVADDMIGRGIARMGVHELA